MFEKYYHCLPNMRDNMGNKKRQPPSNTIVFFNSTNLFRKSALCVLIEYTKKVMNATKILIEVTIICIKAIMKGWKK